jgi:hypothetical protein
MVLYPDFIHFTRDFDDNGFKRYIYIYRAVILRFVKISEVEAILFVVDSVNSSPQIQCFCFNF